MKYAEIHTKYDTQSSLFVCKHDILTKELKKKVNESHIFHDRNTIFLEKPQKWPLVSGFQ